MLNVAKADAICGDLVQLGLVIEGNEQRILGDMETPEAASGLYNDLVISTSGRSALLLRQGWF